MAAERIPQIARPDGEHMGVTWNVLQDAETRVYTIAFQYQGRFGSSTFRVGLTSKPKEDVLRSLCEVYLVGLGHGVELPRDLT